MAVDIDPVHLDSSYAFCRICRITSDLNTCFCFPYLFLMNQDCQLTRRPPDVGGGSEETRNHPLHVPLYSYPHTGDHLCLLLQHPQIGGAWWILIHRPCGRWQCWRQISPGRSPHSAAPCATDPSCAYVSEKKNIQRSERKHKHKK